MHCELVPEGVCTTMEEEARGKVTWVDNVNLLVVPSTPYSSLS